MIEIVIKFDSTKNEYLVYEPTTETLLVTTNLTEALLNLNKFLMDSHMIGTDIIDCSNISYHIDSATMKAIIEGNLQLIKRLRNAPSGFMMSSQRFGQTTQSNKQSNNQQSSQSGKKNKRSRGGFSGAKGFNDAYRKFGNKNL